MWLSLAQPSMVSIQSWGDFSFCGYEAACVLSPYSLQATETCTSFCPPSRPPPPYVHLGHIRKSMGCGSSGLESEFHLTLPLQISSCMTLCSWFHLSDKCFLIHKMWDTIYPFGLG